MLSRLREHLGGAGLIVAVVALVAALTGGAIAANGTGNDNATASAKAKKGPPGPKGPKGPAGPAGPAGAQGAKGDTGAAGPAGEQGPKGDTGAQGPKGDTGAKGVTGATGATGPAGPAGPAGPPGTAVSTLPVGSTLTGVYSQDVITKEPPGTFLPISFPIPLAAPLDEAHTIRVTPVSPNANCPGTVNEPKAASGYLCVYEAMAQTQFVGIATIDPATMALGASVSGALLIYKGTTVVASPPDPLMPQSIGTFRGSWAVTG